MKKIWEKVKNLFQFSQVSISREDEERIKFTEEVRIQLLKLKKKGLALPVFML